MKTNIIYNIDCLEGMKGMPKESVDCIMTSPPYWALRDYEVDGQLGLEKTSDEFIDKLCSIFDQCKRVLKKEGTCWVNLGDTYGSKGNQEKSLLMIPFRFAIEMQKRGWILRNTIIWQKPNCIPSSATDRFTVDFEYLFFFSKKKNYYFKQQRDKRIFDFDKEIKYDGKNPKCTSKKITKEDRDRIRSKGMTKGFGYEKAYNNPLGRNKRSVWRITPKPFSEAHFAVYPEELCETPLKAGCPKEGIVLDPFMGAGTTGIVALKQNKKFIGFELNLDYIKIAEKRLKPHLDQTKINEWF